MIAGAEISTLYRLSAAARPAVQQHLLQLDVDDRYERFATALSDAGIVAYVGQIDFARDHCFAVADPAGALTGFLHLAVCEPVAELAASVLPAWRRCGQARQLFAAALRFAAASGIAEVHLASGHPAARHICAGLGYRLAEGQTYPRARIRLLQTLCSAAGNWTHPPDYRIPAAQALSSGCDL